MSSGNSNNEVPEYSEKEVEKLRYQVIRQGLEDCAILNYEIHSLEERLSVEEKGFFELEKALQAYESTLTELLNEVDISYSSADLDLFQKIEEVEAYTKEVEVEYNQVNHELQELMSSIDELQSAIEKFKKNEGLLRETVKKSESDFHSVDSKYSSLIKQVEEKVNAAEVKMAQFKAANMEKINNLRTQCSKSIEQNRELEETYVAKLTEHQDVLTVYQDIVSKIESVIS